MYWLKYIGIQFVTIFVFCWLHASDGYWRAFGWLLLIPLSPIFISGIGGKLLELELYRPAEFLLWVSMGIQRFLDFLPVNPWWYGKRYPLDQLAELYLRTERFAECQEYAEEAIKLRKDEKSASRPKTMLTLTEALRVQSKLIAAEDSAKKTLETAEAAARGYVPDKWMEPLQARAYKELALIQLEEGLYKEADYTARHSLALLSVAPTNTNIAVYEVVKEYCSILSAIGYAKLECEQAEDALTQFKRVENIARKAFVRENELQVRALIEAAAALIKLEYFEDAEKSLAQAKQFLDESKYNLSIRADYEYALGILALHRKDFPEAEKRFSSALAKREKIYGSLHPRIAPICLSIARTKFETDQSADAETWLKRAIDIYAAQEPINKAKVTSAISLSYVWRGLNSDPKASGNPISPVKESEIGQ